jgi:SpoVK/Ycf46/Vps4 family AAA+-type ATPase
VTFDDVIVEQEVKDTVEQLISMSNFRPNGIPHGLLSQIRITGLLLYGPPGTGKTHLTRAIAKKSGASMLTLTAADIESMWVGETEKYIKAVFSVSAKLAPSVIFIDEVDSLFRGRSSHDRRHERSATNQFLQEMDGLSTSKDSPFVVVATNRPMDLDEAFLRRLPQKLLLSLPSEDNRCRILKTFLKEEALSPRLSIEGLARLTEGFSGSDLRNLCGHAALIFATEQMRAQQTGNTAAPFAHFLLDKGHFEKALERTKPSVSKQTLKEIEEFARRFNPQSTRHLRRGENADGPQEIGRRTEHEGNPPFNPQGSFACPRAREDRIYDGDMIEGFSESLVNN